MLRYVTVCILLLFTNIICVGCGDNGLRYVRESGEDNASAVEGSQPVTDSEESSEDTDAIGDSAGLSGDLVGDLAGETLEAEEFPVYVCGAVVNPGVYYFHYGDIRQSALEAAGGFSDGASLYYVNLAQELVKGERLYFPYEDELSDGLLSEADMDYAEALSDCTDSQDGRLDINTATKDELMSLPGIGESKAEQIISYREQNGPFNTTEDIMNINGIKEGVYNRIKDKISVN